MSFQINLNLNNYPQTSIIKLEEFDKLPNESKKEASLELAKALIEGENISNTSQETLNYLLMEANLPVYTIHDDLCLKVAHVHYDNGKGDVEKTLEVLHKIHHSTYHSVNNFYTGIMNDYFNNESNFFTLNRLRQSTFLNCCLEMEDEHFAKCNLEKILKTFNQFEDKYEKEEIQKIYKKIAKAQEASARAL